MSPLDPYTFPYAHTSVPIYIHICTSLYTQPFMHSPLTFALLTLCLPYCMHRTPFPAHPVSFTACTPFSAHPIGVLPLTACTSFSLHSFRYILKAALAQGDSPSRSPSSSYSCSSGSPPSCLLLIIVPVLYFNPLRVQAI